MLVLKFIIVCLVRFFEYRCVRMPQYAVDENMTVVEVEVEGELAPVFIMPTPLRINHTYSMVSRTTTNQQTKDFGLGDCSLGIEMFSRQVSSLLSLSVLHLFPLVILSVLNTLTFMHVR